VRLLRPGVADLASKQYLFVPQTRGKRGIDAEEPAGARRPLSEIFIVEELMR
jgi:hypothetical protein